MTHPQPRSAPARALGAILAGGASRRFGSPKARAEVGGRALIGRVADALTRSGARPVLITADAELAADLDLPSRADAVPGLGPLGGLQVALHWAAELGLEGALCVACDLPFLSPPLLRSLRERGEAAPGAVVAPESGGRAGLEPLCAWYPVAALARVEEQIEHDRRRLSDLLARLPLVRLPLEQVRRFGDPDRLFLNVNTTAERGRADAIARGAVDDHAES